MLKKTVTYDNLDGQRVSKDLYFNISANELLEKEMNSNETYSQKLKDIGKSEKLTEIYPAVMEFMAFGYGIRTPEGDFEKDSTGGEWDKFKRSLAFQALMDELLMNPDNNGNRLADFLSGMVPADMMKAAREQQAVPGFRPGADVSRPTPPVAGQNADTGAPVSAPVVSEPTPAEAQPVPVAPAEPVVQAPLTLDNFDTTPAVQPSSLTEPTIGEVQQTSTPREPELPGQAQQQ